MQVTTGQHEMILDVSKPIIIEDSYNSMRARYMLEASYSRLVWFDECIEKPPAIKKPIVYGPQRNTRKGKTRKY